MLTRRLNAFEERARAAKLERFAAVTSQETEKAVALLRVRRSSLRPPTKKSKRTREEGTMAF